MSATANRTYEPIEPTEAESRLAQESGRRLSTHLGEYRNLKMRIVEDNKPVEEELIIPASALRLLMDILNEMAAGNAITLIPIHAELTTQQAADLLNVSRPFLIGLLKEGKIPFHQVGTHRRVKYSHLRDYKKQIDGERLKTLQELTAQAQELDMGY